MATTGKQKSFASVSCLPKTNVLWVDTKFERNSSHISKSCSDHFWVYQGYICYKSSKLQSYKFHGDAGNSFWRIITSIVSWGGLFPNVQKNSQENHWTWLALVPSATRGQAAEVGTFWKPPRQQRWRCCTDRKETRTLTTGLIVLNLEGH